MPLWRLWTSTLRMFGECPVAEEPLQLLLQLLINPSPPSSPPLSLCCSELDIMFNIEKAHFILDEMVTNGAIVETNMANILKPILLLEKVSK